MVQTMKVLERKANASLKRIGEIETRLNKPDVTLHEETILNDALDRHRWIVTNALRQKRKFSRKLNDYASST